MYTELVIVNRDCGRRNKFFNIEGWTEEQIQEKIDFYPKDKWFAVKR